MIIVSACLAGLLTRYDGGSAPDPEVMDWVASGLALPVCPEQLAGLPTPRPKICLAAGDGRAVLEGRARAMDEKGVDQSASLIAGAQQVLFLARLVRADRAVLKDKSPSCGSCKVKVNGRVKSGQGVCACLLEREGLTVEAR